MFEQLASLLNAPESGTLVGVFMGILSYVRERIQSRERATIDDYLEWTNNREAMGSERR